MSTINDFFSRPAVEPADPRLRNWKTFLAEPNTTATLEVDLPESDLGQLQPEMHLQFLKDGKALSRETVSWDDELNDGLIHQLSVRGVNSEQESERFALGLRAAFRKSVQEFGDSYFNAVLVELLHDNGFTQNAEIANVLKHALVNRPYPDHNQYKTCRELIENVIRARLKELTQSLKYPRADALQILISALARYLDIRFSVSSRRRLGLLKV